MASGLRRLLGNVADWLGLDEEQADAAQPPAGPKRKRKTEGAPRPKGKAPTADTTDSDAFREIEQGLARVLQDSGTAVAGRVQLLNFEKLRDELGDLWEAMIERVPMVIEGALQRHLAKNDMFWKYGDSAYLIVFASLTPAEAQIKCALVREYVEAYFAGVPEFAGNTEISTVVTTVDGEVRLQKIDDIDALFQAVQAQAAEDKADTQAAATDERAEGAAGATTNKIAAAPPSQEIPEDELLSPSRGVPLVWQRIGIDPASLPKYVRDMELVELPIRDSEQKRLLGAHTIACSRSAKVTQLAGSYLGSNAPVSITTPVDRLVLDRLKDREDGDAEAGRRTGVQIHYRSVATDKKRQEMKGALAALRADQRPDRLIEVAGVPRDVGAIAIERAIQFLHNHAGIVALCSDLHRPHFGPMHVTGETWVGFADTASNVPEEAALDALQAFVGRAREAELRVYGRDLRSKQMVMAALALGVDALIGDTHGVLD